MLVPNIIICQLEAYESYTLSTFSVLYTVVVSPFIGCTISVILLGSFGSPMVFSPSTSGQCEAVANVDLSGDTNCIAVGEYAKDIFTYLKEAEVSLCYTRFRSYLCSNTCTLMH